VVRGSARLCACSQIVGILNHDYRSLTAHLEVQYNQFCLVPK
jgi:hypothetical protein